MRLIANGSVLIAFFAGSACSRDTLTPEISTNPQLESVQSPATPQIAGYSEEVESQEAVQAPLGGEDTESRLREANGRIQTQIDEILALYRRLHIELDDSGRSALIVNLFDDPRLELRRLGFELTDRDLSSNTVLTSEVSEAAKVMLDPIILHETCRMIPLDTKDPVQLRRRMASAYSRCFPCLRGVCHLQSGHVSMGCPNWKEVVAKIDARIASRQ